ncbi:hypothetical protein HDV06_001842 [Boothiomyces sp. JEL0866]|nr:hypothetical protein HDV06_001842 [Boothiomyces sp. JEL0866]
MSFKFLLAATTVLAGIDPTFMQNKLTEIYNEYNPNGYNGYSVALVANGLDGTWDNCITYTIEGPSQFGGNLPITVLVSNRDIGRQCGFTHCGDGGWINWAYEGAWHVDNVGTCNRVWQ